MYLAWGRWDVFMSFRGICVCSKTHGFPKLFPMTITIMLSTLFFLCNSWQLIKVVFNVATSTNSLLYTYLIGCKTLFRERCVISYSVFLIQEKVAWINHASLRFIFVISRSFCFKRNRLFSFLLFVCIFPNHSWLWNLPLIYIQPECHDL